MLPLKFSWWGKKKNKGERYYSELELKTEL